MYHVFNNLVESFNDLAKETDFKLSISPSTRSVFMESGFESIRICCRIRRMRVEGSRIRKEKVADSKISGYVWTGAKQRQ